MFRISGKYNSAEIFQDEDRVEDSCKEQIQTLVDQNFVEGEKIRIMPDCHTGAGCTIGYTQTIGKGKVCPNLVGVDIACGVKVLKLDGISKDCVNFKFFDENVRNEIPFGRALHKEGYPGIRSLIGKLLCSRELKELPRLVKSPGTLGCGNHFIEIDEDEDGCLYMVVHTGSRNLGKQVAEIYQDLANKLCNHNFAENERERNELIARYKAEGRRTEIQAALAEINRKYTVSHNRIPKNLAYLDGEYFEKYINDMKICTEFAITNRRDIMKRLLVCLKNAVKDKNVVKSIEPEDWNGFETMHNYIDFDAGILRKGSVDASAGRMLIIPINMRDGSLICTGRGNEDYNFSAPHGAGRLMSRMKAKETLKMSDFHASMEGIFTTCVSEDTIDESAFAYKSVDDILPHIKDTVDVQYGIRPVYNFKASE